MPGDWAGLRNGLMRNALRHALQPELVEILESALIRETSLRLKLAGDLPAVWQHYPFEWLRFQGSPLQGRLFVERYAPLQSPDGCSFDGRRIAILNLWPDQEKVQPFGGLGLLPDVDVYFGADVAGDFMAGNDLTRISLLVIISHGSESDNGPPFRLGNGATWELPLQYGLPRLVLVVACGNEQGNLIGYGKTLLMRGAQTVIAPIGRLDAESAGRFLHDFLINWLNGIRIDQILLEQQGQAENTHAGWRFCLLGHGLCRLGEPCSAEEWSDARLAETARGHIALGGCPEALLALIERITLHCHQESGTLESAENYLRDPAGLAIPYGHADQELKLLIKLDPLIDRLPVLSARWACPLMGALCEAHNHHRLARYDRLCRERDQFTETPAWAYHYLSKIPYRLGQYTESARNLLAGFQRLDGSCSSAESIRLLGQLLNLLVDLNLGPFGMIVSRHLRTQLNRYTGADSEKLHLNALDRDARLSLRRGDPNNALELFSTKRRKVQNLPDAYRDGQTGTRELAWLLYTASWNNPRSSEGLHYAEQVKQALENPSRLITNMPKGNADPVYLMRALALWCWCANDRDAAEQLVPYARFWRTWLDTDQDPGPIGFAVWFMHLYYRDQCLPPDLPRCEKAEVKLYLGNYFLELAALSALSGHHEKTREYLYRFQAARYDVLEYLEKLSPWLGFENWLAVTQQQMRSESGLLDQRSPVTPGLLLAKGLLPL